MKNISKVNQAKNKTIDNNNTNILKINHYISS